MLAYINSLRSRPEILLMVFAAAMPISLMSWMLLVNNFTVEVASFTGREIGILQSLREVPGFLSFLVVYILIVIAEQRLAFLSLIILGIGTALTGYFPTAIGLYITTVISSIGFHYYETCNQSLALQWLNKKTAPAVLGRIYGVGAAAQVLTLGSIFIAYFIVSGQMSWSLLANSTGLVTSNDTYNFIYVICLLFITSLLSPRPKEFDVSVLGATCFVEPTDDHSSQRL